MPRLFNAYVIAHWSAAAKPGTGADAIHIGVVKRDVRFRFVFEAHTPATRAAAETLILSILEDRARRRERTLLGLDFPLGFPRGLAAALKLSGDPPWRAVWDQLARMVKDRPDNQNNRFGVGSEINRRLTGGPFPFWGCPPRDALTTLQPRRGREHGPADLPEFRHVEVALDAVSPVWKLYYNAATGPQAILGIPMARRLKLARGERLRFWPFETGFKALAEGDLDGVEAIAAEVMPSLVTAQPQPGEAKDAAAVRALAEHYARVDEQGQLGALFAPPKRTAADVVVDAAHEEGWVLGV
ncbi:MAG TPA: cobalamin biosynthesis protein CbiG [Caulobacteraceae bacterium]|nr:cobalamin biosynthesis protein CbiG [Caulobacteraceae bacterium]